MFVLSKEEKIKYLGFDDTWFIVIGVVVISLFVPFAFFSYALVGLSFEGVLLRWLDAMCHGIAYWFGIRSFMVYLRLRMPDFSHTRKRIFYSILFVIVYCGITGALVSQFTTLFAPKLESLIPLQTFTASYFMSFFFVAVYESIYMYHENKKNLLVQEKMQQAHIHSELQGLRNQVNPHFLFNSMNTLMGIIPEDQHLAERFLKKLSSVYRYILEKRDEHLIPLKDELEFAEAYIFLQKERFKNQLDIHMSVNGPSFDSLVLPLSVQILLENAIKHNELSNRFPLKIDIYIDDQNRLVVKNNFQPKSQKMDSTGVGLENIRTRLAYFTKKEMMFNYDNGHFTVAIPLLTASEKLVVV